MFVSLYVQALYYEAWHGSWKDCHVKYTTVSVLAISYYTRPQESFNKDYYITTKLM